MEQYLERTGLAPHLADLPQYSSHGLVEKSFALAAGSLSPQDVQSLYTYKVPVVDASGACSRKKTYADTPYDLRQPLGISASWEELTEHPLTERLVRLNALIRDLANLTKADWIGVYRRTQLADGQWVLLKEAYQGAPSRAEFPLTEAFAQGSNNSTVGLSGKAVVVADVLAYQGPYYECDAMVRSECCIPIFGRDGSVSGIIDAEAFQPNHFTPSVVLSLVEACVRIPECDVLYA